MPISLWISRVFISVFALVSFSYKSQNSCNDKTNNRISAIRINYNTPIVNWDSTVVDFNSLYETYYYGDLIMFKLFYRFDSVSNGVPLLREDRNLYFVLHKDSLFGHAYYPKHNRIMAEGRLEVDSVLAKHRFTTEVFDTLASKKPDSMYYDIEGNLLKVFYDPSYPNRLQSPETFDLYFYYSKKLVNVSETFSKKMDNVEGMKLFRIKVAASGGYYKEYKMAFPPRDYVHEMNEITLENPEEILGYFNRYKTEKQ